MTFNTYLFFSGGTCADAFEQYATVFGGEVTIMRNSDVPAEQRMPGAPDEAVMHAALKVGDALLMGSDDPSGDGGPKVGFNVSYTAPDSETAGRVFAALSEGGDVTMPMQATFWAPAFGMVTDRFGVPWMVDCYQAES